jgi:hypothetical protein
MMENWKRPLFFWTLVILFFITVPLVVFRARGYRFDTDRGVFVYSGTITFKSNPQTVNVTLNEKLAQSKKVDRINNSYNITGLVPATYDVQISADGFQSWNKKIDVHSGLSTELWNVILVRNDYPITANDLPGVEKFFVSPKNNYIASASDSNGSLQVKIWNIDAKRIDSELDFSGWKIIPPERKENIEWSPDETLISVPVQKTADSESLSEAEYDYLISDLSSNASFNLNQFANKTDIKDVRWDPKERGYLFFLSQNSLYRLNTSDASDMVIIASDVSSFDLSGNAVYYSSLANNLIFRVSLDGKSQPAQITSNFPVSEGTAFSRMVVYDETRIALISENHDLYIFNHGDHDTYFKKLGSDISEAHFSNDGKKLLFWTNFEISVYYVRDEASQPVRIEDEMQNVTRYSEPITNVQWLSDFEHIIFSSGRFIKIIELDSRDHRICMDVISTRIQEPFVIYSEYLKKLFFTDKENDTTNLYSIDFPEKTPLLGITGL